MRENRAGRGSRSGSRDLPLEPTRRLGGYTEYAPPPEARTWIRCLWTYVAPRDPPAAAHRVLPHAGVSVCLVFDAGPASTTDPRLLFIGPVREPRIFRPEPGVVLQAVELRAEWCRAVLAAAPEDHVGSLRPFRDLGVARGLDALERNVRAGRCRLGALFEWCYLRCTGARADAATRLAHRALRATAGSGHGRLSSAAASLGVSARHLRRTVGAVTGASPKYLYRLQRLDRIVAEADALPAPPWSRLAVRHGFYDQAHLIHEVRSLTGLTPTQLHAERRRQQVPFFQSTARLGR